MKRKMMRDKEPPMSTIGKDSNGGNGGYDMRETLTYPTENEVAVTERGTATGKKIPTLTS